MDLPAIKKSHALVSNATCPSRALRLASRMHSRRTFLSVSGAAVVLLVAIWISGERSPAPSTNTPAASAPPDLASDRSLHPVEARKTREDQSVSAAVRARLQNLFTGRDARPQEAVLTFANSDAYRRFLQRAQHRGLAVLAQLDGLLSVRVRYDSLAALEADFVEHVADYANVGANHLVHIPGVPPKVERDAGHEVPFRNNTLAFLGVAADHANWGRGITIAVLDTGVPADPTFGNGRVQYLNVGLGTLPAQGSHDGHGASVAALAAGNSPDAPGVAPAASVLSIRVSDSSGTSDIFTVAQAIVAAVDSGAPIVNLSLGGYSTNAVLNAAIGYAHAEGAVVVAAAGNDQAAQLSWPAADPRVISVGSVDATGQQVSFSNSGPQLQIAAPGYGVQTAWLDGQRVYVDGTSASAPLVAGAIAAVMSQNPAFTAQQAWDVIRQTASEAGSPGPDADYGHGVLNLDWAMNIANPARVDPAVASHYYDAAAQQMNFIVENRGAKPLSGLSLDVATNGFGKNFALPPIAPGETHVLKLPVDQAALISNDGLTFVTELVTPVNFEDANAENNRRTSRLNPPKSSNSPSGTSVDD